MNQEERYAVVLRAQAGNADAMEQLLLWTYTPLTWLCRKLLQDRQAADELTQSILTTISKKLDTLQDPDQYDAWFCRIAAARCLQMLPQLRWGSTARTEEAAEETPDIDGKELTEEETIQSVARMVEKLPEDVRVCILLYCCAGIHSKTISAMAGYSLDTVRSYLVRGQELLQDMLNEQQEKGTTFSGITTLKDILKAAMYQTTGEDPIPMVYGILGKEIPDPEKALRRLLTLIMVVLIVVNLVLCGILLLTFKSSHIPLTTVPKAVYTLPPETEATTAPTETTVATEETTLPTEAETTPAAAAETAPKATVAPTQATTPATQPAATQPAASQPTTAAPSTQTTEPEKTGEDGHTHNFKTYSAANCETGGTRRHTCTICEYTYIEELQPTGSHSFTIVPTSSAAATCTSAGKAAKICTKCNYAVNVDDPDKPALGHDYTSTVVAPTSTERGYTLHTCSRCGDSYQDTFVDPVMAPPAAPETTTPEA